ncbi:MAG: hypothetical protein KME26_07940 [Oscillatoria princeps RMCB-10]|nr:hypothetical protein [Oscillatoria princeps RMCB-10]
MNSENKIPDAETRAKSVARWREVCLMFDALNMKLEEAIASAEADIRNNPLNVRRRERAEKLLEAHKQQQSEVIS